MGSSYVIATLQGNQKRESSSTAFLTPAASRSNLKIYTNTMAKKVVFSGKTAKGVLASTGGQQFTLSAKREVILAAGAFQSPQLLMVSGVGPAATLSKYKIPVIADRLAPERLGEVVAVSPTCGMAGASPRYARAALSALQAAARLLVDEPS